jgi:Holliday junction resolvasome RuvABC endonuclease subunit
MRLMSIDPGTYKTAVVLWRQTAGGLKPLANALIECPRDQVLEERLAIIIKTVVDFGTELLVDTVAIERPFLQGEAPAPELNVLFRRLRQEARKKGWAWHPYNPSSVMAAVRPRGTQGWDSKAVIKAGVVMLYGRTWAGMDQNLVDAVAVGHLHQCRSLVEGITAGQPSFRAAEGSPD